MIQKEELKFALDNCTPYPIEFTDDVLDFMADRLLEFCHIEKNPDAVIWNPENPGPLPPVPEVESPTDVPPKPNN